MPLLRSASSFFRNAINSAPDLRMRLFDFVLAVLIEEALVDFFTLILLLASALVINCWVRCTIRFN